MEGEGELFFNDEKSVSIVHSSFKLFVAGNITSIIMGKSVFNCVYIMENVLTVNKL